MSAARPWIEPGISLQERLDRVLLVVESGGWKVRRARGDRLSVTDPIRHIVFIRSSTLKRYYSGEIIPSPNLVATLVHENKHKQQFGDNRFIAAAKVVSYMTNRRVRLAMEIEAEAEETAVRYVMQGVLRVAAPTLSGMQSPYYTGADQKKVEAMILGLAGEILAEEGIK